MSLNWRVVPIERWSGPMTRNRKRSPFDSSWTATQDVLDRELRHLQARDILLQMAVTQRECRNDGWIRADARPSHPGIIITFESRKVGRSLSYPCDTFGDWQSNVRAIALGLEALRKVERYGISPNNEQYTGWAQLPPAGGSSVTMTANAAAVIVVELEGLGANPELILRRDDLYRIAYRNAAKRAHPDAGGSVDGFQRLQVARGVLDRHHGLPGSSS